MNKKWVSIAIVLGLTVVVPAQAETWFCEYDGSWSTFNSSNQGKFHWSVAWQSNAGGGWIISGDYTDRYGKSVLDGNCSNHVCNLTQMYQSGELNGKQYFWNGKYTDQANGNGETINRFEGTWGASPSAGEGAWRAFAICVRK